MRVIIVVTALLLFACSQTQQEPEEQVTVSRELEETQVVKLVEPVVVTASHDMAAIQRHPASAPLFGFAHGHVETGRERYPEFQQNGIHWVKDTPLSTFSVDVDSAGYANLRRMLNQGHLPPVDAIRVEEMINYFDYGYEVGDGLHPFGIYTEVGPSPWSGHGRLLHIGIKARDVDWEDVPPAHLTFLIDVSGSMQSPDKIDLLKQSMKMLVSRLRDEDTVAITVYAGDSGTVLDPTQAREKHKILGAIESLRAGGSTNGEAGIRLAYRLARQHFEAGAVNRVILATDGDFNVGTTDLEDLERLVKHQAGSGVTLTVLGFGTGNYNDALMQKIAQIGNGNAAYIDTMNEARKVLVDELSGTLNVVAKDMKVQVEFNPNVVAAYRLIGYETRALDDVDFNNDNVDAGDVGAGHSVTALYELTFNEDATSLVDQLRYQADERRFEGEAPEVAFVKLRYKPDHEASSQLVTQAIPVSEIRQRIVDTTDTYRFSAAVAWLGQVLKTNEQIENSSIDDVIALASSAKSRDPLGYRGEFVRLAQTASALSPVTEVTGG